MISLVGMPGSGKSTVGKHVARHLGWVFIDTDHLIEQRLGCSIREYFDNRGEDAFRDVEADVLSGELARGEGRRVLATGGGAVLRPDNRRLLRHHSSVIYLHSSPEELARRLRHDTHRPLLQGVADPLQRLRALYAVRDPLYRETAHYVIETGRPSVPTLVNMVLMQIEMAGLTNVADTSAASGASARP